MNKIIGLALLLLSLLACNRMMQAKAIAEPIQVDLFTGGEHGVFNYRIPALTVTSKGTLLAVCDARVDRRGDLPNNIDLIMRRSTDNGQSWSKPAIILDYLSPQGGGDPCLLTDRETGRVWLFFVYSSGRIGINQSRPGFDPDSTQQLMNIYSDDEGQSWSEPSNITRILKDSSWAGVFFASGHGLQTQDGTLMLTLMVREKFGTNKEDHAYVAFSRDHGQTWEVSGPSGKWVGESKVVELENEDIMINMRSKHGLGSRAVSISKDKGRHWSALYHDTTLVEPACNASIISADLGQKNYLLFSNPAHSEKRQNMAVRYSADQGQSWSNPAVIYPGPAAYSSMSLLPDGSIGLLYERGEERADERITFARFSKEWLLNTAK